MRKDRRAQFFLVASVICAALYPVAEPAHRWVAGITSLTYLLLSIASALDSSSRGRQ